MSDFDPAEFAAQPETDPVAYYRVLLDAMQQAGAAGVRQEIATLQRTLAEMRQTANEMDRSAQLFMDAARQADASSTKRLVTIAVIAFASLLIAALFYRWAAEPKIERQLYGCTAKWDAKKRTCGGRWVPLQSS